jgi:hypothetical protein
MGMDSVYVHIGGKAKMTWEEFQELWYKTMAGRELEPVKLGLTALYLFRRYGAAGAYRRILRGTRIWKFRGALPPPPLHTHPQPRNPSASPLRWWPFQGAARPWPSSKSRCTRG